MTTSPALEKAEADPDFIEILDRLTTYIRNERVRAYNEGADANTPSLPSGGDVGGFEHINRIEAMRNRLAAGETTFTLDELKLTLAWADHLNYFLSREKQENATLLAALTASEAERERLKTEVLRAAAIIEWMASYLGRMAPPPNGLAELNEHFLFMEKQFKQFAPLDTSAKHGRPLDQTALIKATP